MEYTSTRNNKLAISLSKAIIQGVSKDGGIYVLNDIKKHHIDLYNLLGKSYTDVANIILKYFKDDFTDDDLFECIRSSYDDSFKTKEVVIIEPVSDYYLLELYHGPTGSFKDIALQFLPKILLKAYKKNNINDDILILSASTGDTAKAVLEGFKNINGIKVAIFYPKYSINSIKEKQMLTTNSKNSFITAVNGNFDDCQKIVKNLFDNEKLNNYLKTKHIHLTNASSINIVIMLSQIIYYFYCYVELVETRQITMGEKVNFTIPYGNFGNILAGYYAYLLGLPVNKFIISDSENNFLYDFFKTGKYSCNSILNNSTNTSNATLANRNIERILFELYDHNSDFIKELMNKLNNEGFYYADDKILQKIHTLFYPTYCTKRDCQNEIKQTYLDDNKLIDPHTACAIKGYKDYKKATNDHTKNIILATTSPYKYARDVYSAIFNENINNDELCIEALSKLTNDEKPPFIKELTKLEIKSCSNINIDEADDLILKIIGD